MEDGLLLRYKGRESRLIKVLHHVEVGVRVGVVEEVIVIGGVFEEPCERAGYRLFSYAKMSIAGVGFQEDKEV